MAEETSITVKPFLMGTPKESAVKVLEEAAEVFGAWQMVDATVTNGDVLAGVWRIDMANEIADVIQAACNLASRYDIDVGAAMVRCEERNRERGRYE